MGKSHASVAKLQELFRIAGSNKQKPRKSVPVVPLKPREVKVQSEASKTKKIEESSLRLNGKNRVPLSQVVSGCLKRWFDGTLEEAIRGDAPMQVLVGQMYFNGYGVPKDIRKGLYWMKRGSKSDTSVWKMSEKHPGYDSNDSDSEKAKDGAKRIR